MRLPRPVALVALAAVACGPAGADRARVGRVQALKERQTQLWRELQARLERDTTIQRARDEEGEVLVVIQTALLRSLVERVAARYLDRVELDLVLDARVRAGGEVHAKGMNAGRWDLDLVIGRLRGVLAARPPRVRIETDQRFSLSLPVALERARGDARLHFRWDARGLANLVCRDFEIQRRLEAFLEPTVETFSGALLLQATETGLRAVPTFEDVPYLVKPVPTAESWATIEEALRQQDSFLRCGLALDPDTMLPKLRERLEQGFKVRLPKKLFRPFDLPASIRTTIEHAGLSLELSVRPGELRFADAALWYSSRISVSR